MQEKMKIAEDYLVPSAMVEVRWLDRFLGQFDFFDAGGEKLPLLSNAFNSRVVGWLETEGREDGEDNRGEETVRFLEGEVTPGRSFSVDPTWSCQQCKNESTRFKAQSCIIVTLSSHIIHTYVIKPLSASSLILSD